MDHAYYYAQHHTVLCHANVTACIITCFIWLQKKSEQVFSTNPVVPTWEEKKSENLTSRVLKSGGWTPQPLTEMPRRRKAQKGVPLGKF